MIDQYRAWLEEQVAYYMEQCLRSADERGYPGKIRFADQTMREILDAYQECLDKLNEMIVASPTPSHE